MTDPADQRVVDHADMNVLLPSELGGDVGGLEHAFVSFISSHMLVGHDRVYQGFQFRLHASQSGNHPLIDPPGALGPNRN